MLMLDDQHLPPTDSQEPGMERAIGALVARAVGGRPSQASGIPSASFQFGGTTTLLALYTAGPTIQFLTKI